MAELLTLVLELVLVGFVFWLLVLVIDQIPMLDPYKRAIRVFITVIALIWLISVILGVPGALPHPPLLRR